MLRCPYTIVPNAGSNKPPTWFVRLTDTRSGRDDLGHRERAGQNRVRDAGQMPVKLVQSNHKLVNLLGQRGLGKVANILLAKSGDGGVQLVHDISRTHVR